MSHSTIHIQDRPFRSPGRASRLLVAVSVALSSAALIGAGAVASTPVPPAPGGPEWSRHLQLEYGSGTGDAIRIGPGGPEWSRHLELEYGR